MTLNKSLTAIAVGLTLASGSAFATNGYFAHGYGTKSKAMAGAGVASSEDAMAAATNPAGMVNVGNRMDFGAGIFAPLRSYTADTPTGATGYGGGAGLVNGAGATVDSGHNLFLIPHFAYNTMLDDNTSVGVAVYGNGGMNTSYDAADTPGGYGTYGMAASPSGKTGVDLMQLFIAPTFAKKFGNVSVGISPIIAAQRFSARGLVNYGGLSNDNTKLTNNGYDMSYGFGAKIGVQAKVNDQLSVGAAYTSRIYMSKFDKYAGLFAEQGDFDIPSNFTLGATFKASPTVTVAADVQHIRYSEVAAIANPIAPNITNCMGAQTSYCLGGDNGIGFGWDNMTIVKLGAEWKYSSDLTLRAGVSTTDAPIPASELVFNIVAPATVETHFTFGGTKKLSDNSEVSFSAMYAPNKKVSGNPTGEQAVSIEMDQYEFEVSYGTTW